MALIYDSRIRAIDSSGNPYVGATLTIYNAGTTTPSSVYRDAALSNAMTNPTSGSDVSDSGGWFPQIFAAEGGLFDITLKTSGGVVIKSYVSVPALGTGTSTITRDYGTSRLQIRGAGGRVYFEGGDASGDDVGGKVTIGGYAGTPADDMVLNTAALSITGAVTTTGALATGGLITENSKKLPGVVQATATASAAGSLSIALANTPTGVTMYDIDLMGVQLSASATIGVTFSYDNGATYQSASSYTTNGTGASTSGTLATSVNTATGYFHARMRMQTSDTSNFKSELVAVTSNSSGTPALVSIAFQSGTLSRVTNVKFTPASGTITGTVRAIPLRGSGDA